MLALLVSLLMAVPAAAPAAPPVQQKRTPWTAVVVKTPEGGHRQGNPAAKVKLVEYGSRSCPTCGRFAAEGVALLRSKYVATGKVSYEYREFPVHPQDLANILLGRCVTPRAFFPVLDAMYAEQRALNARVESMTQAEYERISALSIGEGAVAWARHMGYIEFMARRGVPQARSLQCLRDPVAVQALGKQIDAAQALGVRGTPSFFLGGRKLDNVHDWAGVEAAIKAAGG